MAEFEEEFEFDEEDVWGVAKERDYSTPQIRVSKDSSSSPSSAWRLSTSPRKIPRANSITLPSSESNFANVVRGSSAPVDIPDWSKIYGKNGNKGDSGNGDHYHDGYGDDEDEDNEDDMIPPHEWIAKKLARSQISSFSVFEGIGRTLKGRDLSKVRTAILTKTGFIE